MPRVKFCGLTRPQDIIAANELGCDYVGFVFAPKSKRYVDFDRANELKKMLDPRIASVGVFVNEKIHVIYKLASSGTVDIIQLHGNEDEIYIKEIRRYTEKPIIKAFCIESKEDAEAASRSSADYILLDSGKGTGKTFDWGLIKGIKRPYFLAGGLSPDNALDAVKELNPFALDVSSGIESGGYKDREKMKAFIEAVRMDENRAKCPHLLKLLG